MATQRKVVMPCPVHFIAKRPLHYTLAFLSQNFYNIGLKIFQFLVEFWWKAENVRCYCHLCRVRCAVSLSTYLYWHFVFTILNCIVIVVSPRGGSVVLPGHPPGKPLFTPPPTSPTQTRYPSRSVSPPSPPILLKMSMLSVCCSQDSRGDRSWSWGRWCHDKTPWQPWLYLLKK